MPTLGTTTDHPLRPDGADRRDGHRPFIRPVRLATQGRLGLDLRRASLSIERGGYPSKAWVLPLAERVSPFLPCLAAWSGAFLVTRLRGPRPRWRRLVLQPGLVAAVAALSVLAIESIMLVGSAKIDGRFGWASPERVADFVANGVVMLAHHAGWAVAVSWFTLALIGRWRPERSWVDRGGRVLGCTWIIIGPIASLLIDHTVWWGDFFSP